MKELNITEVEQVSGAGLSHYEVASIGISLVAVGIGISAAPAIGVFGIGVALVSSFSGGFLTGAGLGGFTRKNYEF